MKKSSLGQGDSVKWYRYQHASGSRWWYHYWEPSYHRAIFCTMFSIITSRPKCEILSSYRTFGGTTYMVSSITGPQIFLKWKYHNLYSLWILKCWKAIIRKVMIQTHTRCSILMNSTKKHRFASKVLKNAWANPFTKFSVNSYQYYKIKFTKNNLSLEKTS